MYGFAARTAPRAGIGIHAGRDVDGDDECAALIAEAPDQAFSAASVILSQPRSKKAEERDVLLAAMYSVIPELLPCISTDELKRLRELAAEVPRMYRFPVYTQFMQKIDEMLG